MNEHGAQAWELAIEPLGQRAFVRPGESLLEAAQASGIDLPRSCRNGTCRSCLCKLRSGRVHYRIEWPGLSADEKAEGYVLPCVALPDSDVVLDVPGARLRFDDPT
jgi:ferredoxin